MAREDIEVIRALYAVSSQKSSQKVRQPQRLLKLQNLLQNDELVHFVVCGGTLWVD